MSVAYFPRIPTSNWWRLRAQFQKTLPSKVTASYLRTVLGLATDKAAANLLHPLQVLGLIDSEHRPTALANDWRTDGKYESVCEAIVSTTYPPEMRELFPRANIDRGACKQWLMNVASLGESAADASAQLYMLLNSPFDPQAATIDRHKADRIQAVLTARPTQARAGRSRTQPAGAMRGDRAVAPSTTADRQRGPTAPVAPQLVRLHVHIDASCDPATVDAVLDKIGEHMRRWQDVGNA